MDWKVLFTITRLSKSWIRYFHLDFGNAIYFAENRCVSFLCFSMASLFVYCYYLFFLFSFPLLGLEHHHLYYLPPLILFLHTCIIPKKNNFWNFQHSLQKFQFFFSRNKILWRKKKKIQILRNIFYSTWKFLKIN